MSSWGLKKMELGANLGCYIFSSISLYFLSVQFWVFLKLSGILLSVNFDGLLHLP